MLVRRCRRRTARYSRRTSIQPMNEGEGEGEGEGGDRRRGWWCMGSGQGDKGQHPDVCVVDGGGICPSAPPLVRDEDDQRNKKRRRTFRPTTGWCIPRGRRTPGGKAVDAAEGTSKQDVVLDLDSTLSSWNPNLSSTHSTMSHDSSQENDDPECPNHDRDSHAVPRGLDVEEGAGGVETETPEGESFHGLAFDNVFAAVDHPLDHRKEHEEGEVNASEGGVAGGERETGVGEGEGEGEGAEWPALMDIGSTLGSSSRLG